MNCFNKTQRLLKKSEYDHVFANAKKIVNSEFIILYRDNMIGHPRLGLALSKKMIAKAHDRNRVKRLLREAFRKDKHMPPVDMVILARCNLSNVPNSTLNTTLGIAWNKLSASYAK